MSLTPEFAPSYVSVVNEFPEDLYEAMRTFVRSHPNWDQYRLMQVALAGFLFQQGSRERAVSRHYLDGLFDRAAAPQEAAIPPLPAVARPEVPEAAAEAAQGSPSEASGRPSPATFSGHPLQQTRPLAAPPSHRQRGPLPPQRAR